MVMSASPEATGATRAAALAALCARSASMNSSRRAPPDTAGSLVSLSATARAPVAMAAALPPVRCRAQPSAPPWHGGGRGLGRCGHDHRDIATAVDLGWRSWLRGSVGAQRYREARRLGADPAAVGHALSDLRGVRGGITVGAGLGRRGWTHH